MTRIQILGRFAVIAITLAITGCFDSPFEVAAKITSAAGGAPAAVTVVVDETGRATGTYDPSANYAQQLAATSGEIAGTAVTFPPGALSLSTTIAIEAAASLAQSTTLSDLGLTSDNAVESAGTAIIIRPAENVTLLQPMALSLPLPAGFSLTSGLSLADDQRLAILAKVFDSSGELKSKIIPRSQITIEGGNAKFSTKAFGAFQTVVMEQPITVAKEAKTTEPVANKVGVAVITTTGVVAASTIATTEAKKPLTFPRFSPKLNADRSITVEIDISEANVPMKLCRFMLRDSAKPDTTIFSVEKDGGTIPASVSFTTAPMPPFLSGLMDARITCDAEDGRVARTEWKSIGNLPSAASVPVHTFSIDQSGGLAISGLAIPARIPIWQWFDTFTIDGGNNSSFQVTSNLEGPNGVAGAYASIGQATMVGNNDTHMLNLSLPVTGTWKVTIQIKSPDNKTAVIKWTGTVVYQPSLLGVSCHSWQLAGEPNFAGCVNPGEANQWMLAGGTPPYRVNSIRSVQLSLQNGQFTCDVATVRDWVTTDGLVSLDQSSNTAYFRFTLSQALHAEKRALLIELVDSDNYPVQMPGGGTCGSSNGLLIKPNGSGQTDPTFALRPHYSPGPSINHTAKMASNINSYELLPGANSPKLVALVESPKNDGNLFLAGDKSRTVINQNQTQSYTDQLLISLSKDGLPVPNISAQPGSAGTHYALQNSQGATLNAHGIFVAPVPSAFSGSIARFVLGGIEQTNQGKQLKLSFFNEGSNNGNPTGIFTPGLNSTIEIPNSTFVHKGTGFSLAEETIQGSTVQSLSVYMAGLAGAQGDYSCNGTSGTTWIGGVNIRPEASGPVVRTDSTYNSCGEISDFLVQPQSSTAAPRIQFSALTIPNTYLVMDVKRIFSTLWISTVTSPFGSQGGSGIYPESGENQRLHKLLADGSDWFYGFGTVHSNGSTKLRITRAHYPDLPPALGVDPNFTTPVDIDPAATGVLHTPFALTDSAVITGAAKGQTVVSGSTRNHIYLSGMTSSTSSGKAFIVRFDTDQRNLDPSFTIMTVNMAGSNFSFTAPVLQKDSNGKVARIVTLLGQSSVSGYDPTSVDYSALMGFKP